MERAKRKQIRLKNWDYSQDGGYFVTICTKNREELLCDAAPRRGAPCAPVFSATFSLTVIGEMVDAAIKRIPICYPSVSVEQYVIMPNHIHMIIILHDSGGRTRCAPTIPNIVKQTKEYVTKHLGFSIWQKSYYDHIIRDEQDFQRIWRYIDTNPQKWEDDCYYKESD